MKTSILIALAALGGLIGAESTLAQNGQELFQQALVMERSSGQVRDAILLYERIVVEFADDRALVAQTLIRLGRSHETLGSPEAQQAYQRILSDYPGQTGAAAEARSRLASLQPENDGDRRLGIVARQVWTPAGGGGAGPVDVGSISPDGRYLAFVDWIPGFADDPNLVGHADLAVYDTETGRSRLLTNRPSQSVSSSYVTSMAWSPDGTQIAYSQWNEGFEHEELHVLRSDGSDDHILVANDERPNVRAMAWSQDGDFIVGLFVGWDGVARIGTVSTEDGTVQIIKTLRAHSPWPLSLSPDGRYIVYDYPQADDVAEHDVFILATDGSSEERLVSHSADDERPFWTPDGGRIVFRSDRAGRPGLYAMEVRDGRSAGSVELVRPDIGSVVTLGFDQAGAFYYRLGVNLSDVHVAELDLNGAGMLSESSLLTERFEGTNSSPSWSPDGRRIAYLSNRGDGRGLFAVVKSLDTGEEQDLAIPFTLRRDANGPEWSADGLHLLIEGFEIGVVENPRAMSYRIDVATGEVAPEALFRDVTARNSGALDFATAAQDEGLRQAGVRIVPRAVSRTPSFTDFDEPLGPDEGLMWQNGEGFSRLLPGGVVDEISPRGHIHSWALSPDGTQVAWAVSSDTMLVSDQLLIMPVEGGEIREITRLSRPSSDADPLAEIVAMQWTPDGGTLLYQVGWPQADLEPQLWRVPTDGGAPPARLDLSLDPSRFKFHADGKSIVFWTRTRRAEVWLMEGFSWQDSRP